MIGSMEPTEPQWNWNRNQEPVWNRPEMPLDLQEPRNPGSAIDAQKNGAHIMTDHPADLPPMTQSMSEAFRQYLVALSHRSGADQ